MSMPIAEIVARFDGVLVGDAPVAIQAAKPLSDAPTADDLTLILDAKYASDWTQSPCRVAIGPKGLEVPAKSVVQVADPLGAFIQIVQQLHVKPRTPMQGVHPTAQVHPSATLPADAVVGPYVVIEEGCVLGPRCTLMQGVSLGAHCTLGADVTLMPNVVLYHGCVLHDRITIHANSVIGADGFGYRMHQGQHVKVPQVGYVEIEDDVEIGACTTIDRAALGVTRIGRGTKIDNLVMVAHNCKLGPHNILVAQVGLAGSVTTGSYVVMAGNAGIADHVTIGDGAVIGAMTGVSNDVPAQQKMFGIPARPFGEQARIVACLDQLPDMRRDVRAIKKKLDIEGA